MGAAQKRNQGGFTLGVAGAIAGDSNTAASFDGASGSAASFDGTSGSVSVPAASSLNVGDSFTIEAWVKRARSAAARTR